MNGILRRTIYAATASAVLLTAGCTAVPDARHLISASLPLPGSWVGAGTDLAIMVQFTVSGSTLTGTIDQAYLPSSDAQAVTTTHQGLTGQVSSGRLTLDIDGDTSAAISGTITSTELSLQVPQDSGAIDALTLHPNAAGRYNSQVAALTSQANDNQTAAVRAAAAAATDQQLTADSDAVSSDLAKIDDLITAGVDLAGLNNDVDAGKKDLATANADATKAISEGHDSDGDGCYDASSASYDASSVNYDSGSVDYDAQGINASASALSDQAKELTTDYRQMLSGYQQANQSVDNPDAGTVNASTDRATKTSATWTKKAAAAQTTVRGYLSKANKIAAKANTAAC